MSMPGMGPPPGASRSEQETFYAAEQAAAYFGPDYPGGRMAEAVDRLAAAQHLQAEAAAHLDQQRRSMEYAAPTSEPDPVRPNGSGVTTKSAPRWSTQWLRSSGTAGGDSRPSSAPSVRPWTPAIEGQRRREQQQKPHKVTARLVDLLDHDRWDSILDDGVDGVLLLAALRASRRQPTRFRLRARFPRPTRSFTGWRVRVGTRTRDFLTTKGQMIVVLDGRADSSIPVEDAFFNSEMLRAMHRAVRGAE
jgi:hypothetical protein